MMSNTYCIVLGGGGGGGSGSVPVTESALGEDVDWANACAEGIASKAAVNPSTRMREEYLIIGGVSFGASALDGD
jgi:hypothetical protein